MRQMLSGLKRISMPLTVDNMDRHYGQPSHPSEQPLKAKVLKLREVNTSAWDDFSLSKFFLVALIVLIRIEECRVKPHLSASLRLLWLRRLNRALTLSPGSARLSPWCHQ